VSGFDDTGFTAKRLEDMIVDVRARIAARLGANINTDGDSVLGQWMASELPEIALVWEGMSSQYQAYNPDQATGDQLDQIARLYGVARLGALRATTTLVLAGTPGTVIPIGTRASTADGLTVETTELVTIAGSGTISVGARSVLAGADQVATADAIDTVVTPLAGWDAINSSTALEGGRDRQDDASLRLLLQGAVVGAGVEGAIRTALLTLSDYPIETVLVTSNRSNTTDGNGTPPHAYRVIISPDLSANSAAEEAIARTLWRVQPAGIEGAAIGANARTYEIVDQQGFSQELGWEYPTVVPVEYTGDLVVDLNVGPLTTGDVQQLAYEALERWTDGLTSGASVAPVDVVCVLRAAIPGLKRVDSLLINGAGGELFIAFNERASYNDLTAFTVTTV
jgi:hypothetical protein